MKLATTVGVWLLMASSVAAQPTKAVDRTIVVGLSGSVTLSTRSGSIYVRTWDRHEIQIHASIQAASTEVEDVSRFEETTVEVQSASDSVWIRSYYPTFTSRGWWFGINPRVDYTITAPKTLRWTITDRNATVDIRGVHAALTIDTHNGHVQLADVDGPIQVTAYDGSVTADLVSFRGAEFTSHLGSVDVALPSTSTFHVHADTRRGGVQSDFPLNLRETGRRHTSIDGTVGGGGPSLVFVSRGGELRLRTKR